MNSWKYDVYNLNNGSFRNSFDISVFNPEYFSSNIGVSFPSSFQSLEEDSNKLDIVTSSAFASSFIQSSSSYNCYAIENDYNGFQGISNHLNSSSPSPQSTTDQDLHIPPCQANFDIQSQSWHNLKLSEKLVPNSYRNVSRSDEFRLAPKSTENVNIPHNSQDKMKIMNNPACRIISVTHHKSGRPRAANASKTRRIRWTQELHMKFVQCINKLGGIQKATPKEIVKLMDTTGLTIFHVKSHLQKYRISRYIEEYSDPQMEAKTQLHPNTTGKQITEALRMQVDIQRGLLEQLEVQKSLLSRIEEQTTQLKTMLYYDQKLTI